LTVPVRGTSVVPAGDWGTGSSCEEASVLIRRAYDAFNRGDFVAATAVMSEDVDWHDTWTDSRRRGPAAVRAHWHRLTYHLVPRVEIRGVRCIDRRRVVVDVHLLIHDGAGKLLAEADVLHHIRLRDGMILRMDARAPRSSCR
jgi:ketosteroid isomerase-like protein